MTTLELDQSEIRAGMVLGGGLVVPYLEGDPQLLLEQISQLKRDEHQNLPELRWAISILALREHGAALELSINGAPEVRIPRAMILTGIVGAEVSAMMAGKRYEAGRQLACPADNPYERLIIPRQEGIL